MIEQDTDKSRSYPFYPQKPPPQYESELFLRMLDKETIVVIDEVSGNQVVVFEKK